jgi:Na+-driven multidrug efflux pump
MGNTLPSLTTSAVRVLVVAVPAFVLARRPDFQLVWIWYLTVLAVTLQMGVSLWLLRREFRRRLVFAPAPAVPAAPGLPG